MTLRFLNLIITVPHPKSRTLEAVVEPPKLVVSLASCVDHPQRHRLLSNPDNLSYTFILQPTKVHCENARSKTVPL